MLFGRTISPPIAKRIVNQYSAVFQQRVEAAIRDTEIGFDNESRFTGMSESEDGWITADEARKLLKDRPGVALQRTGGDL